MKRDPIIGASLNTRYKTVSRLDFSVDPHPDGDKDRQAEEHNAMRDIADRYDMEFDTLKWGVDSDIGMRVLQPFLQQGYINDPDFAIGKSGIDIYAEMKRDPIIGASLNTRYKTVSSLDFSVDPHPDGDKDRQVEESKMLKKIIGNIKNRRVSVDNQMDAVMGGKAYGEIIWAFNKDNMIVPREIMPIDKQRIAYSNLGEMRLRTLHSPTLGEKVEPVDSKIKAGKIMTTTYNIDDANSYTGTNIGYKYHGRGLGDELWRYYFIKYNLFGQAAHYAERFAKPWIIVSLPKGENESARASAIATEIRKQRRHGIIVNIVDKENPDAYKMTYMEAGNSGSQFMMEMVKYCDNTVITDILGQNLTGAEGGGTYGKNAVLNDVRADIKISDISMVEDPYNVELIPWIRSFNPTYFDLSEPDPVYSLTWKKARDENLILSRYNFIAGKGIKVNTAQFYEDFGFKQPDGLEEWMLIEQGAATNMNGMTGNDLLGNNIDEDNTKGI
jgi:phage gp29-like protein